MKQVYLSGGINGLSVDAMTTWRLEAARLMPSSWKVFDPTQVEVSTWTDEAVVKHDLAVILRSQAVILKAFPASWGSAMEIFFAYQNDIPVISWIEGEPDNQSRWLKAHSNYLASSLRNAINILVSL